MRRRRPVVIVTGVSRRGGIAAAVVRRLAASGWDVVLTGWPFDQAHEALGAVTALVVVHNYESESSGGLLEVTPAEFDRSMAVNPRADPHVRRRLVNSAHLGP
jgi:NADP-dependent 3-hydroxy acid dehydrogenase YdfG